MQLTENFTVEEFIHSNVARTFSIENQPPPQLLPSLRLTAAGMERIRAFLGDKRIEVVSGYRCAELNNHPKIKGSRASQHMAGEACDFICPTYGTPRDIALALSCSIKVLGIDQLILEKTWIHASFIFMPRYDVITVVDGQVFRGII